MTDVPGSRKKSVSAVSAVSAHSRGARARAISRSMIFECGNELFSYFNRDVEISVSGLFPQAIL